jgi:mRNA-degrading endonuclease RelE of RelBE toxin-antitoxin system
MLLWLNSRLSICQHMFEIEFDDEAVGDLQELKAHERALILKAIEDQLQHQPHVRTKSSKLLRVNPRFTWELRQQPFRIFYDVNVEARAVLIRRVGRKERSDLYIRGELITLAPYEDD